MYLEYSGTENISGNERKSCLVGIFLLTHFCHSLITALQPFIYVSSTDGGEREDETTVVYMSRVCNITQIDK